MGAYTNSLKNYSQGGPVHMWGGGDLAKAAVDPTSAANMAGVGMATNAAGVNNPLDKLNGKGPLSGWIGQAGGAGGTGFSAPEGANVQQGTSVQDVQNAQTGAANSLASQQALLSALQGQQGLNRQTDLANQLSAANGVGTQNQAIQGLQNTAGMYQNVAQGRGPNPAQAMLNQQTGQNIANQAALMAGQRGASANVGLMARQAAQQGGALQQQAVGQGATMQANQQLNALSGLANTQQAFGGLGSTQAAAQQGLANQIAGQQIGATTANTQANLANQQQMQGALQGVNQANVSSQGNINAGNVGLAQTQMGTQQKILGGVGNAAGAAFGMAGGGEVGQIDPAAPASSYGQFLKGWTPELNNSSSGNDVTNQIENNPGTMPVNKSESKEAPSAGGLGMASSIMPAAHGGLAHAGGGVQPSGSSQKAVKSGNSYDNDKVPAMLSEGEIVLPRSVTMSEDPIAASVEFIKKTLEERGHHKTHFAEAGKVVAKKEDEKVDDLKKEVDDIKGAEPVEPAGLTAAPTAAPAPIQETPAAAPVPAEQPPEAPPPTPPTIQPFKSDVARVASTPLLPGETPEDHYAQEVKFQQDLANRHITPETYSGMFGKKDTLGKIGTIFGLMLSGAGSGLTGQSNALLDMMNKEIDRDLEAQKTSKANANTFLSTQHAHDLQTAQALHYTNQNELAQQQIKESKAKIAGLEQANEAINKQVTERAGGKYKKPDATVGADERAKNKMLSTAAQHLDDVTANNPAANQTVQTVIRPAVDAQIKTNIKNADAKKRTADALKAAGQKNETAANDDVIDMKKYHQMLKNGLFVKSQEHKGLVLDPNKDIDPADDKDIQAAMTQKTSVANNYKDVMDAVKTLSSLPNAGETNIGKFVHGLKKIPWIGDTAYAAGQMTVGKRERLRDQTLDALATRLAGTGASDATIEKMRDALAPNMFDSEETLKKIPGIVHNHFNHLKEFHPGVLTKYKIDKDLPEIGVDFKKAKKDRDEAEAKWEKENHIPSALERAGITAFTGGE